MVAMLSCQFEPIVGAAAKPESRYCWFCRASQRGIFWESLPYYLPKVPNVWYIQPRGAAKDAVYLTASCFATKHDDGNACNVSHRCAVRSDVPGPPRGRSAWPLFIEGSPRGDIAAIQKGHPSQQYCQRQRSATRRQQCYLMCCVAIFGCCARWVAVEREKTRDAV
jgi:hypothetical protein